MSTGIFAEGKIIKCIILLWKFEDISPVFRKRVHILISRSFIVLFFFSPACQSNVLLIIILRSYMANSVLVVEVSSCVYKQ